MCHIARTSAHVIIRQNVFLYNATFQELQNAVQLNDILASVRFKHAPGCMPVQHDLS